MIGKLLKPLIGGVVCLSIIGCADKTECRPEIKTVYDVKEVTKTIPCNPPKIDCDFQGNDFVPAQKLLQCVVEQKRALEVCSQSITSN